VSATPAPTPSQRPALTILPDGGIELPEIEIPLVEAAPAQTPNPTPAPTPVPTPAPTATTPESAESWVRIDENGDIYLPEI
jgi:hypothetical protein